MSTLLLQELITAQAERWPDRPAIVWRRTAMTYADLEARSNQLARALRDVGCRRGDRVCVSSMRGPETVIAMLAIYKADAVYVPLDTTGPASRLARIVRTSEPRCILTCAATAPRIDEIFRLIGGSETIPVGSLNPSPIFGERYSTAFCLGDLRQLASRPLAHRNRASNSAQIVFHGGGAGTPQGVVLTHASLRRFILWANEHFGVVAGDRHLLPAGAPADLTTFAVLGTLAAGASLHPVPIDVSRSPTHLADFVREAELTLWLSSAATIGAMAQLDLVQPNDFRSLRHLIWHGDSPRQADLRQWLQRLRHVTFTSLYGAIETTVASCYHTIPHASSLETALPIGRCRPGVGVSILNERLEAVAPQEIGEVCVSGNGLSPGYWRDPESTSNVFTRHSGPNGDAGLFRTGDLGYVGTDGHVYLAGTRESLARSGGHKFEIGEVEAALESLGSVQAAAVVATATETDGSVLCCAYVPAAGLNVLPAELRADLAVLLPPYMLPTRWKAFDRLPQTPDGAVEREQLRHWFTENTGLTR